MISKRAEVVSTAFNKIELRLDGALVEEAPLSRREELEQAARVTNMLMHALKIPAPLHQEADSYAPPIQVTTGG